LQKWRRGAKSLEPSPFIIGVVIDRSIHYMRLIKKRANL
jgi:hypothetical protein